MDQLYRARVDISLRNMIPILITMMINIELNEMKTYQFFFLHIRMDQKSAYIFIKDINNKYKNS